MFAVVVAEIEGLDDASLDAHARELEVEARRLEARRVAVSAELDRRRHGRVDGFASVVAWSRGTFGWSNRQCRNHMQLVRLIVAFPTVGDSLFGGQISIANAEAIARAWANPRLRDRFEEFLGQLLTEAERKEHDDFALIVDRFVMLADVDGAHRDREATHDARTAHFTEFQGKGTLLAQWGDLDTEINRTIFDRQLQAEWDADWALTVREHGEAACAALVPRTDAQRRADAVSAIFRRAGGTTAGTPPDEAEAKAPKPARTVTNVLIDWQNYQDLLAWAGLFPERVRDPFEAADTSLSSWRCETGDGHLIDPVSVLRASLEQYVRFVVLGDDGVPIHWGRERRLFQGAARDAVMSLACRCTAPGCRVPASRSDADHLLPWSEGGRTDPDNGGPRCRRHNRQRNLGFAAERSRYGWHTYRPDGTEIR
jgi:Domain of unknown function (DUF222)